MMIILLCIFLVIGFSVVVVSLGGKKSGIPKVCEPCCGKCGYDLRVNWKTSETCPECGADLQAEKAIHFGKYQQIKSFRILLIAAILLPLILTLPFLRTFNRLAFPVPAVPTGPPSGMNTTTIIAQLTEVMDTKPYWTELERRYDKGMLIAPQMDQTVKQLINELQTKEAKHRGPLLWADTLIEKLITDDAIPVQTAQQLVKVYFNDGPTYFMPSNLKQHPGWFAMYLSFAHNHALSDNLPLKCELVSVTSEATSQRPLHFSPVNRLIEADSDWDDMPMDIPNNIGAKVCIRNDLLPGKHTLIFTFKLALKPSIVVETRKRVLVLVKNDGTIQIVNGTSTDVESK
jgi:uncharacterized protein (DUF983 family)